MVYLVDSRNTWMALFSVLLNWFINFSRSMPDVLPSSPTVTVSQ